MFLIKEVPLKKYYIKKKKKQDSSKPFFLKVSIHHLHHLGCIPKELADLP